MHFLQTALIVSDSAQAPDPPLPGRVFVLSCEPRRNGLVDDRLCERVQRNYSQLGSRLGALTCRGRVNHSRQPSCQRLVLKCTDL
jgi:hypothetical protein